MQDVKRLTKADIITGRDSVTYFYVEEFDGEIALHPLTEGQFNQVQQIKSAGSSLKGNAVMGEDGEIDKVATAKNLEINIDSTKASKYEFEGDATAVAYSMSSRDGEKWTVEEVMEMRPPGVVKKIANEIYKISQVSKEQAEHIASFREDFGGPEPAFASQERDTIS